MAYLAIGLAFAVSGPMWPYLRTRPWFSRRLSEGISIIAADPRAWLAFLFMFFLYGVAPELYRRATILQDHSPSADEIADAIIHKMPDIKSDAAQIIVLQNQLADTQRLNEGLTKDLSAARVQMGELQRQQQTAQNNQFMFPPFPIKKRKLTHSEAVGLIDKLSAFPNSFRLLDQPMSQPLIPSEFPRHMGQMAPSNIDQKKEMASNIYAALSKFTKGLQQDAADVSGFKTEIEDMLGGSDWVSASSLNEMLRSTDNYIQTANSITARPTRPDDELIDYILRDPQASLLRPAQKFNSWRIQIPSRIQELQNEARGDL